MELIRSSVSIASGLPRVIVRSAPAIVFSRPAQRSLTLRPARSRSRQATLYTESSDSFVASAAASIATGWSEPVPGRELHPLKSSAFHGALLQQLLAASLASDRTFYECFRPTRHQVPGIPRFAPIPPIGTGIPLVPWPSPVLSQRLGVVLHFQVTAYQLQMTRHSANRILHSFQHVSSSFQFHGVSDETD